MKELKKICALIPAYNESGKIADVVAKCMEHLQHVFVVDDGSIDAAAREAADAGAQVLMHSENRGKGAALKTGFEQVIADKYDAVVILDADGQHDPDEIPLFKKASIENDADIVIGNRMSKTEEMPLHRYLTNKFTSWVVSKMAGQSIPDSQCGYRLMCLEVLMKINPQSSRYDTESEILIQAGRKGMKIVSVPIRTIYPEDRISKIHPFIDTIRFFKLIWRVKGDGRMEKKKEKEVTIQKPV